MKHKIPILGLCHSMTMMPMIIMILHIFGNCYEMLNPWQRHQMKSWIFTLFVNNAIRHHRRHHRRRHHRTIRTINVGKKVHRTQHINKFRQQMWRRKRDNQISASIHRFICKKICFISHRLLLIRFLLHLALFGCSSGIESEWKMTHRKYSFHHSHPICQCLRICWMCVCVCVSRCSAVPVENSFWKFSIFDKSHKIHENIIYVYSQFQCWSDCQCDKIQIEWPSVVSVLQG